MTYYAENIIGNIEDMDFTLYSRVSKTQKMKAIYHEMKDIVLHDPVFKNWLVGDELNRNWLLERVMKCYFIDGVCWFDASIHSGEFRKKYKTPLLRYITERRTKERQKMKVSA